jgi:hypothetical protein
MLRALNFGRTLKELRVWDRALGRAWEVQKFTLELESFRKARKDNYSLLCL